jgi:site-specific DNA-cytosine methylase
VLDDLFFEAIKGVERLKPKVVIFENVMGLLFKKNKTYAFNAAYSDIFS